MHKVIKPSGDAVEDKSKSLVSMASKLHKLLVKKLQEQQLGSFSFT